MNKAHEMHDSLAVPVHRLSWSISIHFIAIHSLKSEFQPRAAKITLQPPILWVQGHSKSLMLTPLQSLSLLLVMIISMSVDICNYFHATRTINGKITTFREAAVFDACLHRPP